MDDLTCLKVVGILLINFIFSLTISNFLTNDIGLIKSPVTSLKFFCPSYVLGYYILLFMSGQNFANTLLSPSQTKGNFILISLLKWFIGVLTFHCLAVLYGSALLSYLEETFMWSAMMSTLVVLPFLLTEADNIFMVLQGKGRGINFPSCICGTMVLTLLGAWVGAFTLPLDWDRDWQVWPIPCAVGAMVGHFVSLFISGITFLWKHRRKNKNKFV